MTEMNPDIMAAVTARLEEQVENEIRQKTKDKRQKTKDKRQKTKDKNTVRLEVGDLLSIKLQIVQVVRNT